MGRTPQEDVKIEYRRTQVTDLYLKKRWRQVDIGRELGVSQSLISSDLKAIRQEWKESRIRDFDEALDEELKMLAVVIGETWDAWERSQQPIETTRVIQQNGRITAEKKSHKGPGNPWFLQIMIKSIEMHCKLLGLDKAASTFGEHPDEQEIYKKVLGEFWDRLALGDLTKPYVNDDDPIERRLAEELRLGTDATSELEALEAGTGTAA